MGEEVTGEEGEGFGEDILTYGGERARRCSRKTKVEHKQL